MPQHPLAGVVEKLWNADDHLHRLETATREYLEGAPIASIRSERDARDRTRGRLRVQVLREPPLKLAAIAGDIIHNLRSSLDYLVEELVKLNGHRPTFQHQFPICANAGPFSDALRKGRLYGIHEPGLKTVERFQPYQVEPEARRNHPLRRLHTLSNRDKHHMLAIAALNAGFVWKLVGEGGRVLLADQTAEPIRDGETLADVPVDFTINGEQAQLQAQITISVGFDEPAVSGFDVAAALHDIREYISVSMLPAFATFFDALPEALTLTSHGLATPGRRVDMLVLARPSDL